MNCPHFSMSGRAATGSFGGRTWTAGGLISPSPSRTEIENLRRLMNDEPVFTESMLAEFRDRVARGVYFTRSAAEATASRLLDDNIDLE